MSVLSPVCQETIWEAFKIFWDRLPEQEEYQSWMSKCQESTVTAHDIGNYFSQSDEHQALVKKVCAQIMVLRKGTSKQHMMDQPTQRYFSLFLEAVTASCEKVREAPLLCPEAHDFTNELIM